MRKEGDPRSQGQIEPSAILAQARAKADERARAYLNERPLRESKFAEANELFMSRDLSKTAFNLIQQEFRKFQARPENDPALKRAIERIKVEQKPETTETREVIEAQREEKPSTEEKKEFKLGNKEFRGKNAEILEFLSDTTKVEQIISDNLARKIWPGVKLRVSKGRLSTHLGRLRKYLREIGFDVVGDHTVAKENKVGLYLKRPEDVVEELTFTLPDGREIKGDAGEILQIISQYSKENPASHEDLEEKLYLKLRKRDRRRRIDHRLKSAREVIAGTGVEIVNLTSKGSSKGGRYYLERSEPAVEQSIIVEEVKVQPEPAAPVPVEVPSPVVPPSTPAKETMVKSTTPPAVAEGIGGVVRRVVERILPGPKAIEVRDRLVRERIRTFIEEAWKKPILRKKASIEEVNREFQQLKWRHFVQPAVKAGLISINGFGGGGLPRIDIAAVATLLYLKKYGEKLPSQLKKQVQDVASEEFEKHKKREEQSGK